MCLNDVLVRYSVCDSVCVHACVGACVRMCVLAFVRVSMYIYFTVLCTGVLLLALWLPHQHGGRPRRSDVLLPSSSVITPPQV